MDKESLTQKIVTKLSEIWVGDPWDPEKSHPGSGSRGKKNHRTGSPFLFGSATLTFFAVILQCLLYNKNKHYRI